VICDLEQVSIEKVAAAIDGSDCVVFAAGAGPGSGAEPKVTMDRDWAIKLLPAAMLPCVGRYVMVSGSSRSDLIGASIATSQPTFNVTLKVD
jgi:hypothetical protein